jgi:Flp pilus assembly pilin Flp
MGVSGMQPPNDLTSLVSKALRDEGGAAAVEYGVIVMALFMAIIPAFVYVSTGIAVKLQSITGYFESQI